MKQLYLTAFAIFFVAGCATSPVSTNEAAPVPPERIISDVFLATKPNTGEVIIKRDTGFGGSACSSRVFVDGSPVADLRTGEKVTLYLPLGDHIIGAEPNGICGGGLSEVSVTVKKESASVFRIRYGSNGDYDIQPTAF
jgi:hypothetical protein